MTILLDPLVVIDANAFFFAKIIIYNNVEPVGMQIVRPGAC
jgi:hypothetical protein